jgi:hypothetical protein
MSSVWVEARLGGASLLQLQLHVPNLAWSAGAPFVRPKDESSERANKAFWRAVSTTASCANASIPSEGLRLANPEAGDGVAECMLCTFASLQHPTQPQISSEDLSTSTTGLMEGVLT